MKTAVIGIDIGGTNLRCALVTASGTIIDQRRSASGIEGGRESFCSRLLADIAELRDGAARSGIGIQAIGAGVPGLIGRDGQIRSSVNMRPLEGLNLGAFLEERTGIPAACGNDANTIALGEQRFGAGRGVPSFLAVTIGTGLGSGLILDNRLWTGANGFAAEFGHVTVAPDGLPCPCGNRGCLEQYCSAGAVVRAARELVPADRLAAAATEPSAEAVATLARQGVAGARAAFERVGGWLGIALGSLANILNLQAVIVGGGVAASFDLLLPGLEAELAQRCFPHIREGLAILKTELGDDAGLLGGAALAEERLQPPLSPCRR
ncbi:ROK family protein [Geobacter sp. FeAm09]|uniref:ROK family protein n=1 Tax=Geobacter sp. FeAm09 TaxID=2597769 RepID=UPI0011ED5EEC|nr:ROK family protein [Geobacter sp. FeAm09]QEM67887.1 ROK family protein [Geobacter sp. FeAm09]